MQDLDYSMSNDIFYKKYLIKLRNLDLTDTNKFSFNQRGKKYFELEMSLAIWPPENNEDRRLLELLKLKNSDNS